MKSAVAIFARARGALAALSGLFCLLALGACSDAYDQSGPADILLEGHLCHPATPDCPSTTTLQRANELGANRVDFRLTNHGRPAELAVIAQLTLETEGDAGDLDASREDIERPGEDAGDTSSSDPPAGVAHRYQLASGESVSDRFVPEELLTGSPFELSLACDKCEATLDYVLATEPLECRLDSHCSSTWVCRRTDGRCVECLADSHCSSTQTCDLSSQRCTPVDEGGCSSAPSPWPAPLPVALLLIVALGWAQKRQRTPRLGAILLAAALGSVVLGARPALAASPNASVQIGVGPRLLTGKLGDDTLRGIGLKVAQEVRWRNFGGQLTLGTSYFVTTQHAPPLSHELQLYSVAIGPQFYLPLGPVELAAGADFRHIGVVTNSLVRLTGPEINYLGAGGTLQVRYRFGGLAVLLTGGFHPIFGLDSSIFSMNLALGLVTH